MTFVDRAPMLLYFRKRCRHLMASRANRALATIPVFPTLLILLSLAHSLRTFAATPDLETALNGSRQRIQKLDYRVTGRLTKMDANGKRTNYKFVAKAHWFPDGLRFLSEISGPASQKTTLLLYMSVNGRLNIEVIQPGDKAASVLPFEHWNDPLLGTDFSYEDMVESQFFWKNQELLAPTKYGTRDCFLLKSTPSPQDKSSYDTVTTWIDRSILYPVQVVKTLHGTGQQKQFTLFGLRQVGGVWSAAQMEAKLPGKPGSSLLVIESGSPKASLARKDFDIGLSSSQATPVK